MLPYEMKPLASDRPGSRGMSERLIVSHYENNHGGAVKRLNLIEEQLARIDSATAPGLVVNGQPARARMCWQRSAGCSLPASLQPSRQRQSLVQWNRQAEAGEGLGAPRTSMLPRCIGVRIETALQTAHRLVLSNAWRQPKQASGFSRQHPPQIVWFVSH